MIWEKPLPGPPSVITARHCMSGSGVAPGQSVKSGNVEGCWKNSAPFYVGSRSGAWTVSEIRECGGLLEASQGLRLAFPVRPVAGDTSRHIDLLARVELQPPIARLRTQYRPVNPHDPHNNGNCQKIARRLEHNKATAGSWPHHSPLLLCCREKR